MTGSPVIAGGWADGLRPRPVVLYLPHSPSECLGRLAAATTRRGFTAWYLDPANATRHAPAFRGEVSPSRILIARFDDAGGRNSFAPWLTASLQPAASGGSVLTGSIGLRPASKAVLVVLAVVTSLMDLGVLAGGVVLLASGNLRGLPLVLIPLALAVFIAGLLAAGIRSLNKAAPHLLQEVNRLAGPASAAPGAGHFPG